MLYHIFLGQEQILGTCFHINLQPLLFCRFDKLHGFRSRHVAEYQLHTAVLCNHQQLSDCLIFRKFGAGQAMVNRGHFSLFSEFLYHFRNNIIVFRMYRTQLTRLGHFAEAKIHLPVICHRKPHEFLVPSLRRIMEEGFESDNSRLPHFSDFIGIL